jgi:murein DD-endopeptidase MepM/ murein hydrolase activator NlpD
MIGHIGSTGRSTGPHLHYEVRRGTRAIDPMPFVRAGQRIADI